MDTIIDVRNSSSISFVFFRSLSKHMKYFSNSKGLFFTIKNRGFFAYWLSILSFPFLYLRKKIKTLKQNILYLEQFNQFLSYF